MTNEPVGISFDETMKGAFALGATDPQQGEKQGKAGKTELVMHAKVTIRDLDRFIREPGHTGEIVGTIDFKPLGMGLPSTKGVFNLFSKDGDPRTKYMVYELGFRAGAKEYYLAGRKEVRDDPGLDLWTDTTTLFTRLHEGGDATGKVVGAGTLHLNLGQLLKMIPTMTVLGAKNVAEKAAALARFGRFFSAEVYDTYVKPEPTQKKPK